MLPLRALALVRVNSSHTFFEAKQGLVDLSAFCLSVLIILLAIGSALRACEVDQQEATALLDAFLLYLDLANSMGAGRSVVTLGRVCSPQLISLFNQL